jgi:PPP family 3-phenylpropionic acid transporter
MAGLSALIEVPSMLVIGVIATRVGVKPVFVASALIYTICLGSWMVLDTPGTIIVTRSLTGVAFSGIVVSMVLTVSLMLPRELQATGQSLFQVTAFGIGAIVANVVGGLLYELSGHAAVFGLGAALALAAAIVAASAFPNRSPHPRPDAAR